MIINTVCISWNNIRGAGKAISKKLSKHDTSARCHVQEDKEKAKELLQEHFRDEHNVPAAYMEKIFNWPVLKAEDAQRTQEFALFLRVCCNTMEDIEYIEEMYIPVFNLGKIMKWPYMLRERWCSAACEIRVQRQQGNNS